MNLLTFGTPGCSEWALILVIVLALSGAKKLPELPRGLGQSLNVFRKAREDFERELKSATDEVKGQPPVPRQANVPVYTDAVQRPAGALFPNRRTRFPAQPRRALRTA
jgi:sec-independent protein translocase protein TatA